MPTCARRLTGTVAIALLAGCSAERRMDGTDTAAAPADTSGMSSAQNPRACVITPLAIAGIGPGMTLDSARRLLPRAEFLRASDGDGAALVDVKTDTVIMTLSALEDDAEAPIDWSKSIHSIETFNARCATEQGIRPGMLVSDAARLFGNVTRIAMSEIESRQYVTFERQPPEMVFRIDYTGIFAEGQRQTTRYAPHARIFSIAISR